MSENNKMEKEISELYRLFKKYKLAPDFASRCSPYGEERREVAEYLEDTSLHYIDKEMIDYYCFKAIYTMGDEQDLKYFLPRLIELMVMEDSLCNYLFKKIKMSGFEQWDTVEQKLIYKICEQYFILRLNGQSDGTLSSVLDDYVELFDLEPFYQIWFNAEKESAIDHFIIEAEHQCIAKVFYWKYVDKLETIYLETTDLKLKKKLDKFLDQHQSYLKDLYL
ncbi:MULTISPECIES: hypothetical protein [unclassified Acinetobacter]|uniref:hypothetical protein n=1 Tax=unclassified Acinetobacter TaxID=196816 RepID=UPI0025766401|nr:MULTISPECIES: hypothetical protein [unclassified Acinetobacter]MDM1762712.1 hypothetical protein [Acinetobacter sp. 226-1]MDM1766191.1 hypothetical protein [Acinetobacter sp. 226-4]